MGNRLAGLRHCLETATQRTRRCGKLLLNARRDLPHDTLRLWDPRSHGEHRQKSATRRSRVAVSHPWHPNDTQGRQGLGSQVLLYDYVVVMEHALPSTTHGLCSAQLYLSRSVGSSGRGHLVSRQCGKSLLIALRDFPWSQKSRFGAIRDLFEARYRGLEPFGTRPEPEVLVESHPGPVADRK